MKIFRRVTLVLGIFLVFAILTAGSAAASLGANFSWNATTIVKNYENNLQYSVIPLPLSLNFTDHSTGNPNSWHWYVGNNQISTLQNPTYTFPSPGTYDVTLTVYNTTASSSITQQVDVGIAYE